MTTARGPILGGLENLSIGLTDAEQREGFCATADSNPPG
jgi:hypothetical protein